MDGSTTGRSNLQIEDLRGLLLRPTLRRPTLIATMGLRFNVELVTVQGNVGESPFYELRWVRI
jgi:hypothetical protein